MSYSNNPRLPAVRMEAFKLVREKGWGIRKTARYLGFSHGAVLNWLRRLPEYGSHNQLIIPTYSSRPHSHPRALSEEMVKRILDIRSERNQCAEILSHRLLSEGLSVSLSSIKRVLKRHGRTRFSQWKKWHQYPPRPVPEKPGVLVEVDTVLDGVPINRICAYALIDVCSRWAYAEPEERINTHKSLGFIERAAACSPFSMLTIQSDHGPEFSKWFTQRMLERGIEHRHSRVRRPTDNGHVERFNRTLQEECLERIPRTLESWKKGIPEYIRYYNTERPHMGLNMKTPLEVVRSY